MAKGSRTFVKGLSSQQYGLGEFRRRQLEAPRVLGEGSDNLVTPGTAGYSENTTASWRIAPGDDPFLTQTLQVHFVEIPAGGSNTGHGHQNEAVFYILSGKGYEIHDDQRYDWEQGDLVFVHTDSVHQHFNDGDQTAVALVMKAKSTWMYFGLIQQGNIGQHPGDEDRFGPREDWSQIWTPGVVGRTKVVKPNDTPWETTPDGRIRWLASPALPDQRIFSVDVYEQEIAPGSRSGRHWHMADEVLYVLSGAGTSLQWEVEAEIAEKYHARIAKEPTSHRFTAGDTIYVPQNTVHQFVNGSDSEQLKLLSVSNRLFRYLGYDKVAQLDNAPDFDALATPAAAST